jgi:hypothetical protein
MVSLTLKGGSRVEVVDGLVAMEGACVVLYKKVGRNSNNPRHEIELAYALQPGEIVRRTGEGDYVVEF